MNFRAKHIKSFNFKIAIDIIQKMKIALALLSVIGIVQSLNTKMIEQVTGVKEYNLEPV